jgi:thiosulfate dehydrogenase [quinone] large subunit
MSDSSTSPAPVATTGDSLGPLFAVLTLRLWLGLRALVAGVEKFAGRQTAESAVMVDGRANAYGLTESTSAKVYGLEYYDGVPPGLYEQFTAEPLLPNFLLPVYDVVLGPLLILLGLAVLLGIGTRLSLFVMGLVYTSLTFGLILLNQSAGVAWLAAHMVLIAFMLFHADQNRFELGALFRKKGGNR